MNQDKKQIGAIVKVSPSNSSQSAIDLNCDLEVNPDAEVQIIFDSKAGDVMKGTGTGNLNISYNRKGEF